MLAVANPGGLPVRALQFDRTGFRVELADPPRKDANVGAGDDAQPEAWDVPHAGPQPYDPPSGDEN